MKSGKDNANYRHGLHCNPSICECGKEKDYRAKRCAECSGRSYPKDRNYTVSDEQVIAMIALCTSYLEVAERLSISRKRVTDLVKKYDISVIHMRPGRDRITPDEELFTLGDRRKNGTVKKRILEKNLIPYRCGACEQEPFWNGMVLVLELDHINGNPCDDRIENLRFLCPNCHTQTETNKGKNSRKGG